MKLLKTFAFMISVGVTCNMAHAQETGTLKKSKTAAQLF